MGLVLRIILLSVGGCYYHVLNGGGGGWRRQDMKRDLWRNQMQASNLCRIKYQTHENIGFQFNVISFSLGLILTV